MALPVKEFSLDSPEQFLSVVYPSREPCILHGVDIGPAPSLWTIDYLSKICGHDRNVKVHVCPQRHMDFIGKNFMYRYRKNDSIISDRSLRYYLELYLLLNFSKEQNSNSIPTILLIQ